MRLSIVIIEYYCMDLLQNCLRSIRTQYSALAHESIIVSNSRYSDDELNDFKKLNPEVRLVSTGENIGYAGGVNEGLRIARGDYVLILNPDCVLMDDRIETIMNSMDCDNLWAIAGPMVVDDHGAIQPSCRRFPRPWTFLLARTPLRHLPFGRTEAQRYFMEDFDHSTRRCVDWVSGGAMLLKASALDAIGEMDRRYFLYMEDVDWCRACWNKGLRVVFDPTSTVLHAGRHQSIRGGVLTRIVSRNTRLHMESLAKYFLKHGFRSHR